MWKRGSFTIEAAMIMGMVLLVIFSVIQGGIFVYDRAIETAKKYEQIIDEWENEPEPVQYIRRAQLIKNALE